MSPALDLLFHPYPLFQPVLIVEAVVFLVAALVAAQTVAKMKF